jgi:hypothetical protein
MFFSAEKNRKINNFRAAAPFRPWPVTGNLRRDKSLLLLFFRKEDSSFLYASAQELRDRGIKL